MNLVPLRPLGAVMLLLGPASLPGQPEIAPPAPGLYAESGWAHLHGVKRVTTPLLNLTFVTNSGFLPPARAAADPALPASLRLAGLKAADFQEIADAVHAAFVAELRAQGVDVLPYEPLAANSGFQEMARNARGAGREEAVPDRFRTIAGVSGAREARTFVGRRCPWVDSFTLDNHLAANRLTRQLNAALPIVSFLVEFAVYSTRPADTYDWRDRLPATGADFPRLRVRPQIHLSAGSTALLTPAGQAATLTLAAPTGIDGRFVTVFRPIRGRSREERRGPCYEATVDPAAYKRAAISLLRAQVVEIAGLLANGMR